MGFRFKDSHKGLESNQMLDNRNPSSGASRHLLPQGAKVRRGFTLAEVLITLGIIGVVAAMTIPTLMQKHRANVVETRLAKFYSTINQAIQLSEASNGDKMDWEKPSTGWATDEDGNPDKTKEPLAFSWYNKYLKNYLKTTHVDYEKNTNEGKVMAYFPDGSLLLFSSSSMIFYPNAKDYTEVEFNSSSSIRDKSVSGIKYFTFHLEPWNEVRKYHYKKGVEPYKSGWDGTREALLSNPGTGCRKEVTNERAFCTALIQMNGWKIPKDYPLNF